MLTRPTITYQVEPIGGVYNEAAELLTAHWHEVAFYKDLPIKAEMQRYLALEGNGNCVLCTVRADGRLIGYIVYLLTRNLHYGVLEALGDLHFLHADYRKSGIGLGMFKFGEAEMRRRGVVLLIGRTKAAPELNHGAIFEHLGYDKQDIVYTKRLDRGP